MGSEARHLASFLGCSIAVTFSVARADTLLDASSLAFRSSGTVTGSAVTLAQNGYLGTYVRLDAPGAITLSASASGTTSSGVDADMTFAIGDERHSYSVAANSAAYAYTTPVLPAGTYFVRTQLDNHKTILHDGLPVAADTALTLRNLVVSGNATVLNASSNANALAAADTYVAHYRKGDAAVRLQGVAAGTQVHVRLASNAFRLGTCVDGGYSATDSYLQADPAAGSDASRFQQFIDGRFNAVMPSNSGKWDPDAAVSSANVSTPKIGMAVNDQMMAYAVAHGMAARQHTLLWGSQQPAQIRSWLTTAVSTTASTSTKVAAVASLKTAIANRIASYISGVNSVNGKTRAANYQQLDVLNEALQTGNYYTVLGVAGVADVYRQAQAAISAAGLNTRLYTNEYNVLQNSPVAVRPSSTYGAQAAATYGDEYANWYRGEVEAINNAGLAGGSNGNVVTGIGVQYYPTAGGTRGPAVIQKAMQNLSVAGLPMSLTEFGGQTSITPSDAPQLVDDTLRMMMGTPGVDSMMMWGWYDDGTAATNPYGGGTVLVNKGWLNADGTYNLTAAGRRFEYLFGRGVDATAPGANADGSNPNPWTTDQTLTIGPDGTIHFNGFYGTYVLTVDGRDYESTYAKDGPAVLTLAVPEPAPVALGGVAGLLARRRRRTSGTL